MVSIESNVLQLPKLIINNNYTTFYPPYSILEYGPYEKGNINKIEFLYPKDINFNVNFESLFNAPKNAPFSENKDYYFNNWITNPLSISHREIQDINQVFNYIKDKDLLYIIIHNGPVEKEIYWKSKFQGIKNNSKLQFIDIRHLINKNGYTIFNLWIQMLAKCNGTPWIINAPTTDEYIATNNLIIGISYSKSENNNYNYGIVHYIDLLNLYQVIEIQPLRKKESKNLVLDDEEIKQIIEGGIDWYKNKSSPLNIDKLNIYIYKTTQLYKPEENGLIKLLDQNSTIENITHIHVKQGGLVPRIYNLDNDYYDTIGHYFKISASNQSDKKFVYRGKLILSLSGKLNNNKPLGTPLPLFLNIHSTKNNVLDIIAKQLIAMKTIDWGTTSLQNSKIFALKYSKKIAEASQYIKNLDEIKTIDIRYLL